MLARKKEASILIFSFLGNPKQHINAMGNSIGNMMGRNTSSKAGNGGASGKEEKVAKKKSQVKARKPKKDCGRTFIGPSIAVYLSNERCDEGTKICPRCMAVAKGIKKNCAHDPTCKRSRYYLAREVVETTAEAIEAVENEKNVVTTEAGSTEGYYGFPSPPP